MQPPQDDMLTIHRNKRQSMSSAEYNLITEAASMYKHPDLRIAVSAPGKVILHGEHSVVYGKLAIAGSLDLRTTAEYLEVRQTRTAMRPYASVELRGLNLHHNYELNTLKDGLLERHLPLTKSPANYCFDKPDLIQHEQLLESVTKFVNSSSGSSPLSTPQHQSLVSLFYLLSAMLRSVDVPMTEPFALVVDTQLSIGAGIGSSASFLVCIAALLMQVVKLKLGKVPQQGSLTKMGYKNWKPVSVELDKFDHKELELISKWAFCAEKIIHGSPSGIDNSICTFGQMLEYSKTSGPKAIDVPQKFRIVLVDTHVTRDTKALVAKVAELRAKNEKVVDKVLDTMNEIAEEALDLLPLASRETLIGINSTNFGVMPLQHYEKLADLIDMNHGLLRTLRVSHPKLEEVIAIFDAAGLKGKLTGAGGGGFAFGLIPPHFHKVNLLSLLEELEAKQFKAIVTHLGGPGVTIE